MEGLPAPGTTVAAAEEADEKGEKTTVVAEMRMVGTSWMQVGREKE